jgi:hypothetical protein
LLFELLVESLVNDFCDEDDVESDGESAREPTDSDVQHEATGMQKCFVLL